MKKGDIVTIVGPNGGGKTTLLKAILGLREKNAGIIEKNFSSPGYMPQRASINMIFPISVEDFLHTAANRQLSIDDGLNIINAISLKHKKIMHLSIGELQRVLFARAILKNPDILILDEPTQGLDLAGQDEMFNTIGKINKEHGISILLVSHDLQNVMSRSDKVICINRDVKCSGHPSHICHHLSDHIAHYVHKH